MSGNISNVDVDGTNSTSSLDFNSTTVFDDATGYDQNTTVTPPIRRASWFSNYNWSDEFYVTVYGVAVGLVITLALLRGLVFVICSLKCSAGLHLSMVESALHTDISYFNNNPSGKIYRIFSSPYGTKALTFFNC